MLVTNEDKHLLVNCIRNKVSIEYNGKIIEDQYYFTDNMVVLTSEKIINMLENNQKKEKINMIELTIGL